MQEETDETLWSLIDEYTDLKEEAEFLVEEADYKKQQIIRELKNRETKSVSRVNPDRTEEKITVVEPERTNLDVEQFTRWLQTSNQESEVLEDFLINCFDTKPVFNEANFVDFVRKFGLEEMVSEFIVTKYSSPYLKRSKKKEEE